MNNSKIISKFPILHLIGKIISWALFLILLSAAVFLLYYYVATKTYAVKGAGYEPKFSIYTIISPSMTPNINVYDTVVNVRVDDPNGIEIGDVITFISTSLLTPGTTITHRVVGITQDESGKVCYQTKGDFNEIGDQGCAKFNNVIGKVILKIPQLGRIQFFLASKAGWLLCILIPAIYIIAKDIIRITKLSSIKENANKMQIKKVKDPHKEKLESIRKEELKRKLLKDDYTDNKIIYYEEPVIKTVVREKKTK